MGQQRALVFGTTAEQYDAARPGYSDLLVDTVLDYVGRAPSSVRALEIGAGTGKATAAFAGRGLPVLAVEPDPRMAEVLRRNAAAWPGVEVELGLFEQWQPAQPATRRFDLLYAAQAWHWLDPATRRDRVHALLADGGAVALFWNMSPITQPDVHCALVAIDAEYGTELMRLIGLAGQYGDEIESNAGNGWAGWEFGEDTRFTEQHSLRLRNGVSWIGTDAWIARAATHSGVQMLEPERRATLLAAVRRVLDANGGGVEEEWLTDLFLARRYAKGPVQG